MRPANDLQPLFWPANDRRLPTSDLDFRASEVIQSFQLKSSTHCPISLHFPILDPLPCLPRLGQLLHLPQPSYPRRTAQSPLTFLSSTHFPISPTFLSPPTFLSSTHCPISLNFSTLDPLHYLPQTSHPRPTVRPPSTYLSLTHDAIPLST